MKTFILTIILGLSTIAASQRPARCMLPEYIEGTEIRCRASKLMYRFDSGSNVCVKFIYSGCFGTENRFRSLRDCVDFCGAENKLLTPEYCKLEPETGRCKADIESFYFSPSQKKCLQFTYGGCGGNDNNFEYKEDCENECIKYQLN